MENVTHVEIVLENGESYVFKSDKCSVVLNNVVEKVSNLGGRIFKNKVANIVNIVIDNKAYDLTAKELASQSNILEVVLINHLGDTEKYYVKWGETDIDENSLQSSYVDNKGNLVINIKE